MEGSLHRGESDSRKNPSSRDGDIRLIEEI